MPRGVPTTKLETELSLAVALGVVAGYSMREGRRTDNKRRFDLTLADGTQVTYGTKTLQAFMLGVRGTCEARGIGDAL
jgi:hypothetical protein